MAPWILVSSTIMPHLTPKHKNGPSQTAAVMGVPRLRHKASPSKRVTEIFAKLKMLLLTEWPSMRNTNLGVKSGTCVLEDVSTLQLQQLATQLHTLAVSDAGAADTLLALAAALGGQQFQQLQVMLDVLGHEALSDFLRTATAAAALGGAPSCSGCASSSCSRSGNGTLMAHHPGTASAGNQLLDSAAAASGAASSWSGRGRAAAGRLDVDSLQLGLAGAGRSSSDSGGSNVYGSSRQMPATAAEERHAGLRFAALLPPGHLLTKTSEAIQRQREFEAALQAAAAAETPRQGQSLHQQQQQRPISPGWQAMKQMRQAAPHAGMLPQSSAWSQQQRGWCGFGQAPGADGATQICAAPAVRDTELLWRASYQATTRATHASPLSNPLMLAPSVAVVRKHLPPPPLPPPAGAAAAGASRAASASRRATSSRPVSARRGSRIGGPACDTVLGSTADGAAACAHHAGSARLSSVLNGPAWSQSGKHQPQQQWQHTLPQELPAGSAFQATSSGDQGLVAALDSITVPDSRPGSRAAAAGWEQPPPPPRNSSIVAASAAAVAGGTMSGSRPQSAGGAVPPLQLSRLGSMHSAALYRPSSAGSTQRACSHGLASSSRPGSALSSSRLAAATSSRF